jgi:hypothetical protein
MEARCIATMTSTSRARLAFPAQESGADQAAVAAGTGPAGTS